MQRARRATVGQCLHVCVLGINANELRGGQGCSCSTACQNAICTHAACAWNLCSRQAILALLIMASDEPMSATALASVSIWPSMLFAESVLKAARWRSTLLTTGTDRTADCALQSMQSQHAIAYCKRPASTEADEVVRCSFASIRP